MESPDSTNVRIINTLGHVDHGKTTLMDALLAANNIISSRMAGKLRYLDSREDEQERGITMESSAVSLKFQVMDKTADGERSPKTYIINMIDTPGHVDFSSEVSASSRLCDGALVLVDVVEGTIAVLRQAWQDQLRPILVVNKFDRLITELKLTPLEGHHHLSRLIEQVNAIMGGFFASDRMEDDFRWREERDRRLASKKDQYADEAETTANDTDDFQEKDDEDIYFAPERGNVIFASAIDGWGFRVGKFAQLYSAKLGFKEANLRRVLWGDFYLDPKTKKVISYKHLRGRSLKPLFVQFVLENIWAVYDAVVLNPNTEKITKIVTALNLKIAPRDLKTKDARHLLSLIFSQWLSLSTSIIQAVIDVVPSPVVAQAIRLPKMLHPDLYPQIIAPKNKLEEDLFKCSSTPEAYVAAHVSKMFAVSKKDLPENRKRAVTAEELRNQPRHTKPTQTELPLEVSEQSVDSSEVYKDSDQTEESDVILGFARLYSGIICTGDTVYCVLPKYNSSLPPNHSKNANHLITTNVEALYIMMGRELVPVDQIRAGNIFAIKGLAGKVWRNATICGPGHARAVDSSQLQLKDFVINLGGVSRSAAPIVRVAVEPVIPADMPKLVKGLKLLSQSDPCVETFQQQTGEHVVLGAGELHLERCLNDLRDRFARIQIEASNPIVPFRETAVKAPDMAPPKAPNAPRGTVQGSSSNNLVAFKIRAVPLPECIWQFISRNLRALQELQLQHKMVDESEYSLLEREMVLEDEELVAQGDMMHTPSVKPEQFWEVLQEKCKEAGGDWITITDKIWAFGPQDAGSCLLIDARKVDVPHSLRRRHKVDTSVTNGDPPQSDFDFGPHIATGFQLATFQGPLCAEPVEGLAYFVEHFSVDKEGIENETEQNRMAQVTGSVISAVRDACRNGLLDWSPRLMLAMYECDIQASTDVLGKVYGVVSKRRGRIIAEEMKEGTTFFTVSARLPVVESFGFANDIRGRTSGAASPQLIFTGYELLDQDPFWVPTTEEELEDLGEKADRSNVAKVYMDSVRQRKGMFVDRKIVEFAEKQRTLKR